MKTRIIINLKSSLGVASFLALSFCGAQAQNPPPSSGEGDKPAALNPVSIPAQQTSGGKVATSNPVSIPAQQTSGGRFPGGGRGGFYGSRGEASRGGYLTNRELFQGLLKEKQFAEKSLAKLQSMIKAGAAVDEDLGRKEKDVTDIDLQLKHVREAIKWEDFADRLNTKTAIKINNTGLDNILETLSKTSGVKISLAPEIKDPPVMKLDASGTPLYKILATLAKEADFEIAPHNEEIILRNWPHVNSLIERSFMAPWSEEWNTFPVHVLTTVANGGTVLTLGIETPYKNSEISLFGMRGSAPGQPGIFVFGDDGGQNAPASGFPAAALPTNGNSGAGLPAMIAPERVNLQDPLGVGGYSPIGVPALGAQPISAVSFSFTSLGNGMVAVAEPGVNESGKPGVWMTAYRFENGDFKRLKSAFHAFKTPLSSSVMPWGRLGGQGDAYSNRYELRESILSPLNSSPIKSKKVSPKKP